MICQSYAFMHKSLAPVHKTMYNGSDFKFK